MAVPLHTYRFEGVEDASAAYGPMVYVLRHPDALNPAEVVYVGILDGPQSLADRVAEHAAQGWSFDHCKAEPFDLLAQCEFVKEIFVRNFQPEHNSK